MPPAKPAPGTPQDWLARRARLLRRMPSIAGWLHNVAVLVSLNVRKMNRHWNRSRQSAQRIDHKTARPGRLDEQGTLGLYYLNNATYADLATTSTGWGLVTGQDIHLQLDIFGDTMSLTAWLDGESKPSVPQLAANVANLRDALGNQVTTGYVAVGILGSPVMDPGAFRYVEIVPEPSTALMAGIGLLGLGFGGWWSRRGMA